MMTDQFIRQVLLRDEMPLKKVRVLIPFAMPESTGIPVGIHQMCWHCPGSVFFDLLFHCKELCG